MTYFLTFLTSTLSCQIANRCYKNDKIKKFLLWSMICLAIPSTIAGVRSSVVGYDVELYLNRVFELASHRSSILSYLIEITALFPNIGMGFSTIIYVIAHIFKDVHWAYFFINLIPFLFIYIAIYRNKNIQNRGFVWFVILLLLYNVSLNLMRQMIAVSIVYFAQEYVKKKQLGKYIVTIIIASLFHDTAIVFITIFFVYWFIHNKASYVRMLASIALMFGVIFSYSSILNILVRIGVLDSRFITVYSKGFHFGGIISHYMLFSTIFIFLINVLLNSIREDPVINFYTVLVIINLFSFMIGSATSEAYRIGYYFLIFLPEIFDYATRKFEIKLQGSLKLVIAGYSIYFWYILIIVNKFAATVPYVSDFL